MEAHRYLTIFFHMFANFRGLNTSSSLGLLEDLPSLHLEAVNLPGKAFFPSVKCIITRAVDIYLPSLPIETKASCLNLTYFYHAFLMSRFLINQGRFFFLANTIPKPTTVSPFQKWTESFTQIIKESRFNQYTLKSSLVPYFSKPKTFKPSIQLRKFSSNGKLQFIRISNYNYRQNYETLKQASIFALIFIPTTYFVTPYILNLPGVKLINNPSVMVYTLIGANLAVFGLWRIPALWKTLNRYALLEKDRIYSKWSIIGSAFSHQEVWHLAMNMLALYSFGISLATMIGPSNFLSLYLNGAVFSSLASIAYPILLKLPITAPSLGASGALFAIFGTFSALVPTAKIMIFVFPVPGGAAVAFLGSVIWNVAGCVMRWGSFDYAAHLGGSLLGALYGLYLSTKIKEQRSRRLRYY